MNVSIYIYRGFLLFTAIVRPLPFFFRLLLLHYIKLSIELCDALEHSHGTFLVIAACTAVDLHVAGELHVSDHARA